MKGNVLVIEDIKDLSDLVKLYLQKEGLEIKTVETAEEGLALLKVWEPDLILLDLNLPGMDGFEFLSIYRKNRNTPVMIVSARTTDEDLISGFSTGADEFVTKPFSPRVLAARVRALLTRIKNSKETQNRVFQFGSYILDYDVCILKKDDGKIPLTVKEYEVLAYLTENPGRPLGPEQIHNAVWKNDYGDLTTIAVYIQRLRKKIEDDPANPRYIETVHGRGYRFNSIEGGEGR
jgi:two-component system response regulator RegX3